MTVGMDETTKMLRSGLGKQVLSSHSTTAAYGFGTQGRDAYQKQYLSPEQTKVIVGNNSQGAVYKTYAAIGPQPESKYSTLPAPGFGTAPRNNKDRRGPIPGPGTYKHEGALGNMVESKRSTSPRAVFGNSTRDTESKVWLDEELMKTYAGRGTPGPNSYKNYTSTGRQPDSKYNTLPAWKQSTAERFKESNPMRSNPGAGTYKPVNDALGKQVLSSKTTLPMPKIGTSKRDAAKKIFISKEHEKASYGENSPGPTTGNVVDSIGTQPLSVKKTNPSWGFGTSKRWNAHNSEVPGPGAYWA